MQQINVKLLFFPNEQKSIPQKYRSVILLSTDKFVKNIFQ